MMSLGTNHKTSLQKNLLFFSIISKKVKFRIKEHTNKLIFACIEAKSLRNNNSKMPCFQPPTLQAGIAVPH